MFNLATKHGIRRDNPVRAVTKYREQSRERFLAAEELPRFFSKLQSANYDDEFRDFVLLCLYTGARCGNVLAMRREQIDGTVWTIPRTKNGAAQRVYLCPEAVAVVSQRSGEDYLFERRSIPHKTWNRFRAAAEMPDLRIHDLRRTLGSWQAATGASLPVIGKTLGHLSFNVTQVYARLDLSPVQQAVDTAVRAMTLAVQQQQQQNESGVTRAKLHIADGEMSVVTLDGRVLKSFPIPEPKCTGPARFDTSAHRKVRSKVARYCKQKGVELT
jgi:integrase